MSMSEIPASSASRAERVGGLELGLVLRDREVVAARDHRRAARGQVVGALAPLARQPAAGRAGSTAMTPMPCSRQVGRTSASMPRARSEYGGCSQTKRCRPALARDPLRLDDLRRRVGRRAEVADLALRDEVGQRAERLLVVGPRVPAVHLVEVDPVGVQALERRLDLAEDPAPRVARLVGVVAHRAVELRREDDVVAPPAGERLADDLLRLAARVDVGGVDEVDPRVERAVDDPDALVVVGLAPGAEHHRPEAEGADVDAGAREGALFHAAGRYCGGEAATARTRHCSGTPLSSCMPAVGECHARPGHEVADGARDEHLAGARERRDARADVHGDPAEVVVAEQLALAGVQPGAQADAERLDRVTQLAAPPPAPASACRRRRAARRRGS